MRFTAASEHFKFYAQRRFIEFADVISPREAEILRQNAEAVLSARCKTHQCLDKNTHDLYLSGRDVWRDSPSIKKIISKPMIGKIAVELFKQKLLRLAFDQLFFSSNDHLCPFDRPRTLRQMSCLKQITGGVAIRLSHEEEPLPDSEDFCPYPSQAGSILFLHPDIQLSFDAFYKTPGRSLLLLAYSGDRTVYTLDESDPFTHTLKKQGYVFGDLLRNDTHPVFYR